MQTKHDIEMHDGLPVVRGRLIRQSVEHPDTAILQTPCPLHGFHIHGWSLSDSPASLSHRANRCGGLFPDGYYVGLENRDDHKRFRRGR